ncbi:hypothetical protein [Paramaledivibacter caminithermalis]|jgi:hypothetical protein|uniref:DUF6199 domain-containing protein n=1 Tax=Paramaledivibacter caminithermalis (strain DSM 15212 / CIP 107654 / DViRD3) TaxID=1121301 RepID=A0A1M6SEM2_PARC5|nr:hypothetical protein [Paramaledivibacter caminithermalis]SHK43099.1 hypothetical protein SAMN02745912_03285 [Paramaledivibacter caminithermalis DSM 15212]
MLEQLYDKYGKRKIYLAIAFLIIVLNILILTITYQSKIKFTIDGQGFKYISHSDENIIFQDKEGNEVLVTIDLSHSGYTFSSIAGKYEIKYKDKTIKYDSSDWNNKGCFITLSDGRKYKQNFIRINVGEVSQADKFIPFDVQLVNNIEEVYDFIDGNFMIVIFIFSIPLIFFGLAGIMYPERIWDFQHILDVSGGEPTNFAIMLNVIGGILVIGFALLNPFIYN